MTSYSISEIKSKFQAETLDIVMNPKTNKLFVTANGKPIAAVSHKFDKTLPKQFVELVDETSGEVTLCLCNQSTTNVQFSL